jgi:hypothetical protein
MHRCIDAVADSAWMIMIAAASARRIDLSIKGCRDRPKAARFAVNSGNMPGTGHAKFAWIIGLYPLIFVRCGSMLLRCGSALRYRCPPWAFPP